MAERTTNASGLDREVTARLYFLHAVSPIHIGVAEGLGAVNLPTAKEAITGYPVIPGSSVKGVLRALAEARFGAARETPFRKGSETVIHEVWRAFGPPTTSAEEGRGALSFGDAQLLALPMRSLCGTFAWVTSPYLLRRFRREHEAIKDATPLPTAVTQSGNPPQVATPDGGPSVLWFLGPGDDKPGHVFLEETPVKAEPDPLVSGWAKWIASAAWRDDPESQRFFQERFLLVDDDSIQRLCDTSLEVRARVKIDPDTGTAADSGPWLEELIPAESLFHGLVWGQDALFRVKAAGDAGDGGSGAAKETTLEGKAGDAVSDVAALIKDNSVVRFGGKASVGRGRARFRLWPA